MTTDPPVDTKQDDPRPRTKISPAWWGLLLALMVWNIILYLPAATPQVEISYSEFLDQLDANNVAQVTIKGAEISGAFREVITAPTTTLPPSLTTPPTTTQPPSTSSTSTTQSPSTTVAPKTFAEFHTVLPEVVGDPDLLPTLKRRGVEIVAEEQKPDIWSAILVNLLPMALLIGVLVWIGRRTMQSQSGMFSFGKSSARRYTSERPEVTFADVAGADEAKQELVEAVDFLQNPDKYHRIGARLPRGFLLVGPPGTGKTLLARAVAGEASVPFFTISASEFVEMFVGVGASRVRDLFKQAKESAPSIVFIDELDAVGRRRGAGVGMVNDEREQTLNQLLTEMDGFDERANVIVLAATNRPDVLDPALLRPGRFDREVTVPMPDFEGRVGILRIHTKKLRLTPDVDIEAVARQTMGMSGADLANLANEAALAAAGADRDQVTRKDFEVAIDKIQLGSERHTVMSDHDRKVIAYHESGHTIMAWMTPGADPVSKVTIVAHGRSLGVTAQVPEEERLNYSRSYLRGRLAIMLSGRAAEELVFEDYTTGAESDLVEASKLARHMVTRWGMGSFGPIAINIDEDQPFLGYDLARGRVVSEEMASQIDHDIEDLINGRHDEALRVLSEHRELLDALAAALLERETITDDELTEILGPRPTPE